MKSECASKRLRILQIVESAATGVGRHVIDLVGAASAAGHKVDVVYSSTREDSLFRGARGELANRFTDVPMRRAPGPADLAVLRAIGREIAVSGPYDILHGHSSKGGMMARLAGLGRPSKVVFTPHAIATLDPSLSYFPTLLYGWGEATLARMTDAIVAVSTDERNHIIGLGVPPKKVILIPNATDPPKSGPRAQVRAQLSLRPDQVAVGFVGRLSNQKAIGILVEAVARIPAADRPHVVVVGEGETGAAARQRAVELGCADCITWLGAVDAHWYYSAFDLLALPSLYEGFSYTALEAFGAGLPILATDVGGMQDIVDDGITGFIVKPGDVEQFTERLVQLSSDTELRIRFGAATLTRYALRGGRQRMIDATLSLYHALIDT